MGCAVVNTIIRAPSPAKRLITLKTAFLIGLIIAFSGLAPAVALGSDLPADDIDFFEKEVRPLLARSCWQCHGDAKAKANLRLTSRAAVLAGGVSGPAAVAGKPLESRLLKAVRYQGDLQMPPGGKLGDPQIDILERWIKLGLPWPDDPAPSAKLPPHQTPGDPQSLWAYQPVKVVPPTSRDDGWAITQVDRYILAGLQARGLRPTPRADRATLLRRATFDLIGLPPTPEEIDAFVQDESPDAFARVVDRLLASPHYGERWGRHWLDVIRYADSSGRVAEFKEIWRYRDWVTKALNQDLPYTDFIRLQLAGDLLQPTDPDRFDEDGLVATGMLAITQFDPGSQKPQLYADSVDDLVDVVSRSFLGLTLACARCHDHKFDPLTIDDYYAFAGIFANIRTTTTLNMDPSRVIVPLASPSEVQRIEQHRKQVAELEKELQRLRQGGKQKDKPGDDLKAQIDEKQKRLDELRKQRSPAASRTAVVVKEGGHADTVYKDFHDAPILLRGDPSKPGKFVPRGFPKGLGGGSQPAIRQGSGRLELARWLTRPDHPLTARVMVNRIWQHHMGEGLVRTPNNFGVRGERPTHPELLDYLAAEFVRSGWSIKAMHRLILNSAVYQQRSVAAAELLAADPANRLWGRMNRRRLDAEAFRDRLLAVSGKLERTIGGPGTEDLLVPRRTHYLMTIRSATKPNGFNVLFERPDPGLVSDQRGESILATQALFLLNDPFVHAQAKALAQRLETVPIAPAPDAGIRQVYRLILGRAPTPREVEIGRDLLRQAAPANYNAWERYCQLLLCTNEFLYVD
jgi:hypothetical protein